VRYAAGRMETRAATADDLPAIEAVFRASAKVWAEDRPFLEANPDEIAAPVDLVNRGQVRVAVKSGTIVAFSSWVILHESAWEVDDLFVRPDLMRHGIGRRLLEEMAEAATIAGCVRLGVTANPQALGFYEKLGFVVLGLVPTRFRPGVRMQRPLRP
jgi:ribosomal protein S18 acetylase RimI-like enzyme